MVIFMIYKLTKEHYVPPPNYCVLAMICNHSGIPLCGLEKNKLCYRMFLDECDLYEYNCDNKAEYFSSDINNCSQINDTNNQDLCTNNIQNVNRTTIASTVVEIVTTTVTTTKATTVKSTTAVPNYTALSNITTCTGGMYNLTTEKVTEKSYYSTETVQDTTMSIDPNTIEMNEDKEESTTIASTLLLYNVTVANKTTQYSSTAVPTQTEITISNITKTTTEEVMENNSNGTLENTTINSDNITMIIDNVTSITVLNTSTAKKDTAANTSTITKEATNATVPITKKTTIDKMDIKPENCDFPSYCDRPKVWLTTSKGETRDFYRIIKDNDKRKEKLRMNISTGKSKL